MAVFGKVSGRLALPDAIGNELLRWLTKPKVTQKQSLGIAAAGSLALSLSANVLADRPRKSDHVAVRFACSRCFGDMTSSTESLARNFPSIPYTIYRALQISLMHLRCYAANPGRWCKY